MMDWDRVQSQHNLETPNVIRGRRYGVLRRLTHNPRPLRPRCRIYNFLELFDLDDLGKLRLGLRDSRAWVCTRSGLLGSNDFKNGPHRLFGLGTFFGLPFALWAGSFLGFLPHQLVGVDRWGHFGYLSCWDEVGMINGGADGGGPGHKQNGGLNRRLLWVRHSWAFEEGVELGSVAECWHLILQLLILLFYTLVHKG